MSIFYRAFSADSGSGGKPEIHGVVLRHKFMIANGKGELGFCYYSVLSSRWPCGIAVLMLYLLNKHLHTSEVV